MTNCELGYIRKNRVQFITSMRLRVLCREKLKNASQSVYNEAKSIFVFVTYIIS